MPVAGLLGVHAGEADGSMTRAPATPHGCPICEAPVARAVLEARDWEWGSGQSFSFVKCGRCGLVRIDPRPTPEELSRFYPQENWPRLQAAGDPLGAWILGVPWRQLMRSRAAAIRAVVPGPARLLEIGCGDGYFLRYMHESGWEVEGIEPARPAVEFARERLGVGVHCGRLEELSLRERAYDVIYMHHVFEHLASPLETLRCLRPLLAEGGWLYLAVPNWRSLDRKIFGACWVGLKPPQHLFVYDRATLQSLLAKAGFVLRKSATYSREGTSLIGYTESLRYRLLERGLRRETPRELAATAGPARFDEPLRSEEAWKRLVQRAENGLWWPVYTLADRLGYGTNLKAWVQRE